MLLSKTETSYCTIPLINHVIEVLKHERVKQLQNKLIFVSKYNKEFEDYISVWEDGHFKAPEYVSKKFHKIFKNNSELPMIRFHDLRHTCASLLVALNVPMKIISKILGHHGINITMDYYADVPVNVMRNELNKIGNILFKDIT